MAMSEARVSQRAIGVCEWCPACSRRTFGWADWCCGRCGTFSLAQYRGDHADPAIAGNPTLDGAEAELRQVGLLTPRIATGLLLARLRDRREAA